MKHRVFTAVGTLEMLRLSSVLLQRYNSILISDIFVDPEKALKFPDFVVLTFVFNSWDTVNTIQYKK